MTSKDVFISVGAVALLQGLATAQQAAQTGAAQAAPAAPLASCAQVQPVVENVIVDATRRLEGARQTNDPAQMRAAVDHFGSALRDIRTQLAPCATPAGGPDSHAGHAVPKTAAPPSPRTATPATVADLHAGHDLPTKKAAPVTPSPTARDTAAKPKSKVTPSPHAGHQKPPASKAAAEPRATTPPAKGSDPHAAHTEPADPKKERDPVNGLTVDPSTAPKTTYQGRTFYFSSEQSLKQFLENPAKFVKVAKK
jgi:YHS domain-containing protein